MFNKKILILTFVFAFLFAVSVVSAADNATSDVVSVEETIGGIVSVEENQTIEQNYDDELIGVDEGTFTALQNKINNASEGSTITLENDYVYDEGFDKQGMLISKDLTIDGNNYVIDAKSKAGIFYLSGSNIVLKNINFKDGSVSMSGGAIYSNGANFTIESCDFINCSATRGGAIYNYHGDNCIVNSCNFINCTSTLYGGAVYRVNVTDSYFLHCFSRFGGAVYNASVINTTFERCSARDGLAVSNGNAYDCTFKYMIDSKKSAMVSGNNINPTYIDGEKKNATINVVFPERVNNFNDYYYAVRGWEIVWYNKNRDYISVNVPVDVTGNVSLYIDGVLKCTKEIGDASNLYPIDNLFNLSCGKHVWEIKYDGNRIYNPSSISGTFIFSSYMQVNIPNQYVLADYEEDIYNNPDVQGYVNFYIDGKLVGSGKYYDNLNGFYGWGGIGFNVGKFAYGSHNYTLSHTNGSDKVPEMSLSGVFEIVPFKFENDNLFSTYGNNVSLNVIFNDKSRKNFEVFLNGEKIMPEISKKYDRSLFIYTMNICNLRLGENKLSVRYLGDSTCPPKTLTATIHTSPGINMPDSLAYDDEGVVSLKLPEDAVGSLRVTINDTTYLSSKLVKGEAKIKLPAIGFNKTKITAEYIGTGYAVDMITKTFIGNAKVNLPQEMYIKSKENLTFELPSDADGKLSISIMYRTPEYTFKDGKATVDLSYLDSNAVHPIVITYTGDSKYPDYKNEFSLSVISKIPEIEFTLPDTIIRNTKVTATVTCDEGISAIRLSEFWDVEEFFDMVVIYPKNGKATFTFTPIYAQNYVFDWDLSPDSKCNEYADAFSSGTVSFKVISNGTITASPLTKTYADSSVFKVRVYDLNGNIVKGKYVTFKVNGKNVYTTKTDSKGYASYKPTQTPGTYRISAICNAVVTTKTLTVKHLVTLKSVTVKKSAKSLVLTATLGKVNGKYLKSKQVTFKFNGKTYKAKTNAKGVAKVTIKSNVLNKLKVNKKITYQATYLKDTVKKTTKIKK